jgi:gliding motility-associated-like protein
MQKRLFLFLLLCLQLILHAHNKGNNSNYTFIENKGQWDSNIQFKAEVAGNTIYFEKGAFHYQFISVPHKHGSAASEDSVIRGHVFKARFLGSNPTVSFTKEGVSPHYFNYFKGNDPKRWRGKVKQYQVITYENIYQGIDLEVYQVEESIKYDYHIAPGSKPEQIKVQYQGVDHPSIVDGQLHIAHHLGSLIEEKPFAYQLIEGRKQEVTCNYYLNEKGEVGFQFPEGYDREKALIIDPELIFSTYSGSVTDNWGMSATYDNSGHGYMGGVAFDFGYLTTLGAFDRTFNGGNTSSLPMDIVLMKLSPDGSTQIYSTYLGGTGNETIHSMVVNENEELLIFGASSSSDFPTTTNAYDRSASGLDFNFFTDVHQFREGADIVVTKFGKDGDTLVGSTYFGGNHADGVNFVGIATPPYSGLVYNYGDSHRGEIALDSAGNCYIGTSTWSTDLTTSTLNSNSGLQDGLILKFNQDLSNLIWARYLGGSDKDAIYSLKVIDNNRVLVGGGTISQDFPVSNNSYTTLPPGGRADGFISIISSNGATVEKSTFIGTSNYDQVYFIDFDRFGGIYGLGQSEGGTFPLKNAPKADTAAGQFIVKLDINLDSLVFSTTFGNGFNVGRVNISPTAFLVDRCQNIYASGWGGDLSSVIDPNRDLGGMYIAPQAFQSSTDGNDFYLYVLNREVDSIVYASYFGGNRSQDHVDGGTSRFDKEGIIYQSVCASCGGFNDFPLKNSFSNVNGSTNCNNAIFKFDFEILPRANFSISRVEGCEPFQATIADSSKNATELIWDFNGTIVTNLRSDTTVTFTTPGTFWITQIARDTICGSEDRDSIKITVYPNHLMLQPSNDTVVCKSDTIELSANSLGTADIFTWSSNAQFTDTLNSSISDSIIRIEPGLGSTTFYIQIRENAVNPCIRTDSVTVERLNLQASALLLVDSVCANENVNVLSSMNAVSNFEWDFGNNTTNTVDRTPTVSYPIAGDYIIKLRYSNNRCNISDSLSVPIHVAPNTLQLAPLRDTIFCTGDTITLRQNSFGTAQRFLWSSTPGFNDTLNTTLRDSSIRIFTPVSANYYARIEDDFCSLEAVQLLEFKAYQLELQALIDTACTPYTTELLSTVIGTDSFRINWGTNSTTTDTTPQISLLSEGLYRIELIGSSEQCLRADTLKDSIQVYQSVRLQAFTDTAFCLGESILLKGNSFGTAQQFVWDTSPNFNNPISGPNDSSIIISPKLATVYYLKGTNVFCEDLESITVTPEEVAVDVDDLLSICLDDSLEIEATVMNAIGPLSFSWSPASEIISGQNSSKIIVAPSSSTNYTLISESLNNCKDYDTVEVEVNPPAFTDAEILLSRDSIFVGERIQLSTNRNGSNLLYQWEPANGMDNPRSASPELSVSGSTTFKVTITDLNTGCVVEQLREIFVFEVNCAEPDIFIPTAFTPNGDLNNDILFVRGANLESIEFQLYNRWGELVFETRDKNTGWDGTYKGREVDPGVFAYYLKAICFDGQEFFKKGDITLIR